MTATEEGLLHRAQAGDREALGDLLVAHQQACYSFAWRLTRNSADAEDVCQEAFSRAVRDVAAWKPVGSFRSWLLSIVVCAHRDRLDSEAARRRRERSLAMGDPRTTAPGNHAAGEREELRKHLEASLDRLKEAYRLPIVLHYEQGLSYAEAAAALEVPEGTVATNIRRGIEELRGMMARAGYGAAALGAGVLEGALSQAPAVSVPAGLTAFVKSLAASGGAKAAVGAGAAAAGTLSLGWKLAAGASLAAVLGLGGFAGWRRLHPAAAAQPSAASPSPAAPTVVPRGSDAGPVLAGLRRRGVAVEMLGIGRLGVLLVPSELRARAVGARELVDGVAGFSGLKVHWSPDGKIAVLHRGAGDDVLARVRRMAGSAEAAARADAAWEAGFLSDPRVLPPLLALAGDGEAEVAAEAAESLRRLGWRAVLALQKEEAWPLALRQLSAPDAPDSDRADLLEALATTGDERAVPALAAALEDLSYGNRGIRAAAAEGLGRIGGAAAQPLFEKALKDRDPYVRRKTVAALAEWDGRPREEMLRLALRDLDRNVRTEALASLAATGNREAIPLLETAAMLQGSRRDALEALVDDFPQEAGRFLKTTAEEGWGRFDILSALGRLGGDEAATTLREQFRLGADGGWNWRWRWVMPALGELGGPTALELLGKALKDDQPDVRMAAVSALGRIGGPEAMKLLQKAATDTYRGVRSRSAGNLIWSGSPEATNLLGRLLKDADADVRRSAIRQLCWQGEARALPLLEGSARDPDGSVRSESMTAIRSLGGPAARDALEKLLDDRDPSIRLKAAGELLWLRPLRPEKALAVLGAAMDSPDKSLHDQAVSAVDPRPLRRVPGAARQAFIAKAVATSADMKINNALYLLDRRDGETALRLLQDALNNGNPNVRSCAVNKIGFICGPEGLPLLEKAMGDKSDAVRSGVPQSLGLIGGKAALELLKRCLKDAYASTRRSAVSALSRFEDEEVSGLLKTMIADKDSFVRQDAARILGERDGKDGLAFVAEALANPDSMVRDGAVASLTGRGPEEALPLLEKALDDADKRVRRRAAACLGLFEGPAALKLLVKAVNNPEEEVWHAALQSLRDLGNSGAAAVIEHAMASANPRLRAYAVEQVGAIGGPGARALLRKALGDKDLNVRLSGARQWIWAGLDPKAAIPVLEEAMAAEEKPGQPYSARRQAVNILATSIRSAEAYRLLQKAAEDKDPHVRAEAVDGLAQTGGAKALDRLIEGLRDQDAYVRDHAAWGLAYLGGEKGGAPARDALIEAFKIEKDRYTRIRMAEHLARGFPGDPIVEKALKDLKLPEAHRPEPRPRPEPEPVPAPPEVF